MTLLVGAVSRSRSRNFRSAQAWFFPQPLHCGELSRGDIKLDERALHRQALRGTSAAQKIVHDFAHCILIAREPNGSRAFFLILY